MQIWMPDFIRQKQEEDNDIKAVIQWFKDNSKPDWNTVRTKSPAFKAYWHQLDSFKIIDRILYRQLEPLQEYNSQLVSASSFIKNRILRFSSYRPSRTHGNDENINTQD